MSIGSPDKDLDQPERGLDRRRWFEQVVMLPVAIGMLSATVGLVAHDVANKVFGTSSSVLDHDGPPLAIISAAFAISAFVIAAIRWHRR